MDQAKEIVENISDKTQLLARSQNGVIAVVAVIAVVVVLFLVIGLYFVINRAMNNRRKYTLRGTNTPVVTSKFQMFEADKVPSSGNGKRMSLGFWIYIHDMDKFHGLYRNVFYRGDGAETFATASPTVLLDSSTNKLHVLFGSEKPDPYDKNEPKLNVTGDKLQDQANKIQYLIATRGITLEYIPIQRWVHVGIVVNEEVNGGTISGYLDGELVKVVKTSKNDVKVPVTGAQGGDVFTKLTLQNMNLDKRGNVYVGGSMDASVPGFSGLVSKITFFNYDLNAHDMYKIFVQGPVDAMARKLGTAYGIRTPITRAG